MSNMNKRILIVEDETDIATWFKKQLDMRGGFDVDLADGGRKALEMMSQTQYDLIFLDLVMPEFDGIEVLKELKTSPEKYKAAPIMALTNVTTEDTKKEVEDLGIVKFIVKTDADIDVVVDEFFKLNSSNI